MLALRNKAGLTQNQLATRSGVPRSTLTNAESGDGNPSLKNLVKISSALGVGIEELLSRPRRECSLVSAGEISVQNKSGGQVQVHKLMPDKIKGLDIDRIEFASGAVMSGHPHLEGTKEYLTVIQGEIAVHVAGSRFEVRKGDVLAFPGDQPHSYRNLKQSPSIALSIVIPVPAG